MKDEITNRTGEYLKMHADIEHEADTAPVLERQTEVDLNALRFGPWAVVQQIGEACRDHSTAEYEVVGEISWINGKPVVALRRELRPAGLEALLRRGSDSPLFRRQAS